MAERGRVSGEADGCRPIDISKMTPEQKRAVLGCEHYGDPQPRRLGESYRVHWRGYVMDPKPTDELRASGCRVVVHGDAYHLATNEVVLTPTRFPLPEPWSELWLDVAAITRRENRKLCGGPEGERFLSNGRAIFRVDEDVYQAALAAGFQVLPESASWSGVYRSAMELPHVRVALDTAVEVDHEPPYVKVGQACLSPAYVEILRKLGVEWVLVTGTPPEGHRGTASPVLSDLAIVMPMCIKDDEPERGGGRR